MTSQAAIIGFRGEFAWLNNFWPCDLSYQGHVYRTAEHAFQAAKTTSEEERAWIAEAKSPAGAEARGKAVTLRAGWDDQRRRVMLEVISAKFQDPELARLLLATGDRQLIEENSWGDRFWGVYCGRGENQLGLILMEVRSALRRGDLRPTASSPRCG